MAKEFRDYLGGETARPRLGFFINEMYKLERDYFDVEFERIGITFSQFRVLNWLWREGELTQRQIHELINIKPSSLSNTLKILVKKGLVVQKFDARDARVRKIALTDAAKAIEKEAWEIIESFDARVRAVLGAQEYERTVTNLEKLIENL